MSKVPTFEVELTQEPVGDGRAVDIKAWAMDKLTNGFEVINWPQEKKRYPHLADLRIAPITAEAPDILIAVDHSDLHIPLETRIGKPNEPYGFKTCLGWTVLGRLDEERKAKGVRCVAKSYHASTRLPTLPEVAKMFYDGENFGVEHDRTIRSEEKLWDEIQAGITKLEGPGYQVKLPWKGPRPSNNIHLAETRLRSTIASLERKTEKKVQYIAALDEYIAEGYAVVAYDYNPKDRTGPQHEPGQHYLPHHWVTTARGEKTCVVFDAAATSAKNALLLNDHLHTGPKLQVKLPAALSRWREEDYCYMADIKSMFSRIHLCEEDAKLHSWLWQYPRKETIMVMAPLHAWPLQPCTGRPQTMGKESLMLWR